ncbi:hypothetical protein BCR42DRAFT_493384 [Absidia repens]|uniref:Uncharacterized protein n=1 Tax=Absidia repens TaxID=90262 RepID=A0A1X2IA55_9FUNG|nr:hypothetical protein BCR42DRAFT_493384 [Absidia repens]
MRLRTTSDCYIPSASPAQLPPDYPEIKRPSSQITAAVFNDLTSPHKPHLLEPAKEHKTFGQHPTHTTTKTLARSVFLPRNFDSFSAFLKHVTVIHSDEYDFYDELIQNTIQTSADRDAPSDKIYGDNTNMDYYVDGPWTPSHLVIDINIPAARIPIS